MNCPYCGYVENSAGPTHVCTYRVRPHIQPSPSANTALDYMTAKCDRLKEENAALKAEVERLTEVATERWQTLQLRDEQINDAEAENDLLKTNYLIVQEENAQLRAERDDLADALAGLRLDIENLLHAQTLRAVVRGYANQNTSASEEPPR